MLKITEKRERGVPQNEYKLWLPVTAMLACGKERTQFSFFHIISQKQNEVYLVVVLCSLQKRLNTDISIRSRRNLFLLHMMIGVGQACRLLGLGAVCRRLGPPGQGMHTPHY